MRKLAKYYSSLILANSHNIELKCYALDKVHRIAIKIDSSSIIYGGKNES